MDNNPEHPRGVRPFGAQGKHHCTNRLLIVKFYYRIPHQKHDLKKSPYEIMYGIKPDMTKVKVFGCEVYELISKQSNTGLGQMLNPRAKAFMYVGH